MVDCSGVYQLPSNTTDTGLCNVHNEIVTIAISVSATILLLHLSVNAMLLLAACELLV